MPIIRWNIDEMQFSGEWPAAPADLDHAAELPFLVHLTTFR